LAADRHLSIADLDGDGANEIIVSGGRLSVLSSSGALQGQIPYSGFALFEGISIADVDGDGSQEIAAIVENDSPNRTLRLYRSNLSLMPGYPLIVGSTSTFFETTAFGDLDLDGDLELVFNYSETTLSALDLPVTGPEPPRIAWSQRGHDSTSGYNLEHGLPPAAFRRGDANHSDTTDVADAVAMLNFLFLGAPHDCLARLDANDDEQLDVSDPVFLLLYLFAGGPPLPEPAAACRPTIGLTTLDCATSCP
jgi:hypothetical protein